MNISIEEIKEAKDRGHTLDTLIAMLEKKADMYKQHRHWFVVKGGRNICEFCGCAYRFGDSSDCDQLLTKK